MIRSLRTGLSYIDVSLDGGGVLSNLYCSSSINLSENQKELILDFSKIDKARIKTDSNDDLEFLYEEIDSISKICFNDRQVTERLIRIGLFQEEIVKVIFFSTNQTNKEMKVLFQSIENFSLSKL